MAPWSPELGSTAIDTVPRVPSTRTGRPLGTTANAPAAPTTAGMPSSRATMAACESRPPVSVTTAATTDSSGVQAGSVVRQTSTSPRCTWTKSSTSCTGRAGPVARPGLLGVPDMRRALRSRRGACPRPAASSMSRGVTGAMGVTGPSRLAMEVMGVTGGVMGVVVHGPVRAIGMGLEDSAAGSPCTAHSTSRGHPTMRSALRASRAKRRSSAVDRESRQRSPGGTVPPLQPALDEVETARLAAQDALDPAVDAHRHGVRGHDAVDDRGAEAPRGVDDDTGAAGDGVPGEGHT